MAEIHDGTGVIIKTSSDSCEVSVTMDDTSHSISFNKSIFYTFGMQCEGNMTNILENGMEVELCYRIFPPGRKPCVVAVWLGEKPDNLAEGQSSLKAVYDSNGHVVSSADNDFVVQDQDNNIVYINKGVVYQDGSPLKDNMTIDQKIMFDAVPFKYEHPSGTAYQATCAWIGPKPRLVDRFDLHSTKLDSGLSGKDIVEGTVAVIPNDVVALVDVVLESKLIKVFIFRSSFKDQCTSIGDVIAIGDVLSMSLAYKSIFPGQKLWYASQAAKSRDALYLNPEVLPDALIEIESKLPETCASDTAKSRDDLYLNPEVSPETLIEIESKLPETYAPDKADLCLNDVYRDGLCLNPEVFPDSLIEIEGKLPETYASDTAKSRDDLYLNPEVFPDSLFEIESKLPETCVSHTARSRDDRCFNPEVSPESLIKIDSKPPCNVADEQLVKFSKDTEILYNIPPLSGVISLLQSGYEACITYGDIKIFVPHQSFYIAGNRCSDADFMHYVAPGVNIAFFEAILIPDGHKTDFSHEATCAWVGRSQKPTVQVLAAPLCKPNPLLLKKGKCLVGFVAKYLSPFMAFVLIPEELTYVLIDVSNFDIQCQPRYVPVDKARVFITNYVKLNDTVQFNLKMNPRFPALFLTYNIRFLSSAGSSGSNSPDLNEASNHGLDEKVNPDLNVKNPDKSLTGQKETRKKKRKPPL